jgi:hypothetical protein
MAIFFQLLVLIGIPVILYLGIKFWFYVLVYIDYVMIFLFVWGLLSEILGVHNAFGITAAVIACSGWWFLRDNFPLVEKISSFLLAVGMGIFVAIQSVFDSLDWQWRVIIGIVSFCIVFALRSTGYAEYESRKSGD